MEFDQERDRLSHGYDAGLIIDGVVFIDSKTGEAILTDDEGVGFNPNQALTTLVGKKVRMTIITLDAIEEMEKLLEAAQATFGKL